MKGIPLNWSFLMALRRVGIGAFKKVFAQMKEKGFKPAFNVTDNQAVKTIKAYLKAQDCNYQFVEPSNHRVNATERAIQTLKTIL